MLPELTPSKQQRRQLKEKVQHVKNDNRLSLGSGAASAYYFNDLPKTPYSSSKRRHTTLGLARTPSTAEEKRNCSMMMAYATPGAAGTRSPIAEADDEDEDEDDDLASNHKESDNTKDLTGVQSVLSENTNSDSSRDDSMNKSVLSDTTELTASNFVLAATSRHRLSLSRKELLRMRDELNSKMTIQKKSDDFTGNEHVEPRRGDTLDTAIKVNGHEESIMEEKGVMRKERNPLQPVELSIVAPAVVGGSKVQTPSPSMRQRINADTLSVRRLTASLQKGRPTSNGRRQSVLVMGKNDLSITSQSNPPFTHRLKVVASPARTSEIDTLTTGNDTLVSEDQTFSIMDLSSDSEKENTSESRSVVDQSTNREEITTTLEVDNISEHTKYLSSVDDALMSVETASMRSGWSSEKKSNYDDGRTFKDRGDDIRVEQRARRQSTGAGSVGSMWSTFKEARRTSVESRTDSVADGQSFASLFDGLQDGENSIQSKPASPPSATKGKPTQLDRRPFTQIDNVKSRACGETDSGVASFVTVADKEVATITGTDFPAMSHREKSPTANLSPTLNTWSNVSSPLVDMEKTSTIQFSPEQTPKILLLHDSPARNTRSRTPGKVSKIASPQLLISSASSAKKSRTESILSVDSPARRTRSHSTVSENIFGEQSITSNVHLQHSSEKKRGCRRMTADTNDLRALMMELQNEGVVIGEMQANKEETCTKHEVKDNTHDVSNVRIGLGKKNSFSHDSPSPRKLSSRTDNETVDVSDLSFLLQDHFHQKGNEEASSQIEYNESSKELQSPLRRAEVDDLAFDRLIDGHSEVSINSRFLIYSPSLTGPRSGRPKLSPPRRIGSVRRPTPYGKRVAPRSPSSPHYDSESPSNSDSISLSKSISTSFIPKSILNSNRKRSAFGDDDSESTPPKRSRRVVAFGSPAAAEYNLGSPSVNMTPLHPKMVKAMFAMPPSASEASSNVSNDGHSSSAESVNYKSTVELESDINELLLDVQIGVARSPQFAPHFESQHSVGDGERKLRRVLRCAGSTFADSGALSVSPVAGKCEHTVELEGDMAALMSMANCEDISMQPYEPSDNADEPSSDVSIQLDDTESVASVNTLQDGSDEDGEIGFIRSGRLNFGEKTDTTKEGSFFQSKTGLTNVNGWKVEHVQEHTVELEEGIVDLFERAVNKDSNAGTFVGPHTFSAEKIPSGLVSKSDRFSFGERERSGMARNVQTPDSSVIDFDAADPVGNQQTMELETNVTGLLALADSCIKNGVSGNGRNSEVCEKELFLNGSKTSVPSLVSSSEKQSSPIVEKSLEHALVFPRCKQHSESDLLSRSINTDILSSSTKVDVSARRVRLSTPSKTRLSFSGDIGSQADFSPLTSESQVPCALDRRLSKVDDSACHNLNSDVILDLSAEELLSAANQSGAICFKVDTLLSAIDTAADKGIDCIVEVGGSILEAVCSEVEYKVHDISDTGKKWLAVGMENNQKGIKMLQKLVRIESDASKFEIKKVTLLARLSQRVHDFVVSEWGLWENQVAEALRENIESLSTGVRDDESVLNRHSCLVDDVFETFNILENKVARKARRRSLDRRKCSTQTLHRNICELESQINEMELVYEDIFSQVNSLKTIANCVAIEEDAQSGISILEKTLKDREKSFRLQEGFLQWVPAIMEHSKVSVYFNGASRQVGRLNLTLSISNTGPVICSACIEKDASSTLSNCGNPLNLAGEKIYSLCQEMNSVILPSSTEIGTAIQNVEWKINRVGIVSCEVEALLDKFGATFERETDKVFVLTVDFTSRKESTKFRACFDVKEDYPYSPIDVHICPLIGAEFLDIVGLTRHLTKNARPGFGYITRMVDVISAFLR